MSKIGTFFKNLGQHIAALWAKEPQAEATITTVLQAVEKLDIKIDSPEADIIASMFPNGVGGKTLAELRELVPYATEGLEIGQHALGASATITDPVLKANAVITTVLTEVAALPAAAKEAHYLTFISAIVSRILGVSVTEATHLVTAKQLEIQNGAAPALSAPAVQADANATPGANKDAAPADTNKPNLPVEEVNAGEVKNNISAPAPNFVSDAAKSNNLPAPEVVPGSNSGDKSNNIPVTEAAPQTVGMNSDSGAAPAAGNAAEQAK